MLAKKLSTWLSLKGGHYSWIIATVTFLAMLSSSAALGLPGALMQPLSAEFGWTTDQISSALALRFFLYGMLGPFAAIFMARYGVRAVVCTALLLIAAGMALATQITSLWHLWVLWGLLLGVGTGLTALVLAAVTTNRWFISRRGLVIGCLSASSATGQLIFLPIAAWIIENYGWRAAVFPIFLFCGAVAAMAFFFLRENPGQLSIAPYGAPPNYQQNIPVQTQTSLTLLEPFRVLRDAIRYRAFWVLAGTFFICGISTSGLVQTHFITLCGDNGVSPLPAASMLATMGAFDFVGTILSGWLSDRYDNRKLLFLYYGLRALSLFWLPHSGFTLYGLSIFAMFYGLDWIATIPPTVRLTTSVFGPNKAPMVFGWIFAAHQMGSALAAYGGGLSRTFLLTYNPALYVAATACVIAATSIFILRKPAQTAT